MEKDRYLKREYLYRTANKELFIGPIAHSIKQKLIRRNSGWNIGAILFSSTERKDTNTIMNAGKFKQKPSNIVIRATNPQKP